MILLMERGIISVHWEEEEEEGKYSFPRNITYNHRERVGPYNNSLSDPFRVNKLNN
jgi:hypothetical protein